MSIKKLSFDDFPVGKWVWALNTPQHLQNAIGWRFFTFGAIKFKEKPQTAEQPLKLVPHDGFILTIHFWLPFVIV